MATRRFQLKTNESDELIRAYASSKDGPTRTRYQAVRLYGEGYPVKEIEAITGCSRCSLMVWCRTYRTHGSTGLVDKRVGGNRAKLTTAQIQMVSERLRAYTPGELFGLAANTEDGQFWTVEDLHQAVKQWTGVTW
jgi:transposase